MVARAQDFESYLPALKPGAKKSPILIYVHGGAWVSGDKSQYQKLGKKLSEQGLCVLVANYSLAPKAQHPKPVQEIVAILKKANSSTSAGCDAQRIFLMGHSAGAHLIAFLDSAFLEQGVKGYIGLEGIYDLPDLAKKWPTYKEQFLKAEFGPEKNWVEASPARWPLKSKAPWLLIHSEKDELVDPQQTENFAGHLRNLGIPLEIMILKTESHFGVVDSLAEGNPPLMKKFLEFIL